MTSLGGYKGTLGQSNGDDQVKGRDVRKRIELGRGNEGFYAARSMGLLYNLSERKYYRNHTMGEVRVGRYRSGLLEEIDSMVYLL